MPTEERRATRSRLLTAAINLIEESGGQDLSLRDVCQAAGVTTPTLYHFYGSKQGLISAVTDHGFDLYYDEITALKPTGDVIDDIRNGWDVHVSFGLTRPGLYMLMCGTPGPGPTPESQARPGTVLRELTLRAVEEDRLIVPASQAEAHLLVSNIGVTLRQVVLGAAEPILTEAVREGAIAAVTGVNVARPGRVLQMASEVATAKSAVIGAQETRLLIEWLERLDHETRSEPS